MKKLFMVLISAMLMLTTVLGAVKDYNIYVDNKLVETDVKPFISGETTVVPISFIARELGATVEWKSPNVTITKGDIQLVLTNTSNIVYKNGVPIYTDYITFSQEGRIFVPVRFISDQLGYSVAYEEVNNGEKIQCNINIDSTKTVETNISIIKEDSAFVLSDDGKWGYTIHTTPNIQYLVFVKNMDTGEVKQVNIEWLKINNIFWTKNNKLLYTYEVPAGESRTFILYNPVDGEFTYLVDCLDLYYIPSMDSVMVRNRFVRGETFVDECAIINLGTKESKDISKAEYDDYLVKYKDEIIKR